MRRYLFPFLAFVVLNSLMFGFNNCSPLHDPNMSNLSSSSIDTSSPAALQAQAVLTANCASCHGGPSGQGGVSNITNLADLVSEGLIVPQNPDGSLLIQQVKAHNMPPTGPLSDTDIASLVAWVTNPDGGSATPVEPPPATAPTYAKIFTNILTPHCLSCHGATSPNDGRPHFDTYTGTMAVVTASDLTDSLLYTQTASGAMPQGGPVLGTSDLEAISQWIMNGAQND